jgi:hypothetical protein
MLASSIVKRSFSGLMQPLDYGQGAPVGFLFLEKASILIFGNHDYILRLFPLLMSSLAIVFMWRVTEIYLDDWPDQLLYRFLPCATD